MVHDSLRPTAAASRGTGATCWRPTATPTWPGRWSGSGAWAPAAGWPSSWDATRTIRCSCRSRRRTPRSSSRPWGRVLSATTATGWWRASAWCRRPATSCWAGTRRGGRRGLPRLLHAPALGLEGLGRRRHHGPRPLGVYAEMCAWSLARAHARSGDRSPSAPTWGRRDLRSGDGHLRRRLRRPERPGPPGAGGRHRRRRHHRRPRPVTRSVRTRERQRGDDHDG